MFTNFFERISREKVRKAGILLMQLVSMPLVAAYLASTGTYWVMAALQGFVASFLVTLPFAFWAGAKAWWREMTRD